MFIFLSFVCKCFRFSESEFPTQSSSSNCVYLQYLQLEQESFFFWEIVQPIAMLLRFSRHYFHVTSGGFFMSPFLSNQYHFVEVNTFDAGINAPTSSNQLLIVFWKCIIAPPPSLNLPTPIPRLLIFDQFRVYFVRALFVFQNLQQTSSNWTGVDPKSLYFWT